MPRLVNILADKALLSCYVDGRYMVEPAHVPEEDLALSLPDDLLTAEQAAKSSETVATDQQREQAKSSEPVRTDPVDRSLVTEADNRDDRPHMNRGGSSGLARRILYSLWAVFVLVVVVFGIWLVRRGGEENGRVSVEPIQARSEGTIPVKVTPDSLIKAVNTVTPDDTTASTLLRTSEVEIKVAEDDTSAIDYDEAESTVEPSPGDEAVVGRPAEEFDYVVDLSGPCIHVASFLEYEHAELMRDRLIQVSPRTAILKVTISDKIWFRVYSGPWDSVAEAQHFDEVIRDAHVSDWTLLVILAGARSGG